MLQQAERIRIIRIPSGQIVAEGPGGWDITPFEGNLYIRRRDLRKRNFKVNVLPARTRSLVRAYLAGIRFSAT